MQDDERTEAEKAAQQEIDARYWFISGIQRSGDHGHPKIVYFSEADIQKAKFDQEFFEQKIYDLIARYPDKIFDVISDDKFVDLFTDEQVADAVRRAVETDPSDVVFNFDKVAKFFLPEEQDDILLQSCRAESSSYAFLSRATTPYLSKFKDHEEWESIAVKAIARSNRHLLHEVNNGLEQGIFRPDFVVKAVNKLMDDNRDVGEALGLASAFPETFSPAERDALAERAKAFFKKKEHAGDFYALSSAKSLLSQSDLEEITLDYLKTFPDQASNMLDTISSVLGPEAVEHWLEVQIDTKAEIRMFGGWGVDDILNKHISSPELKRKFVQRMLEVRPESAIEILKEIRDLYPPEEVQTITKKILEHASASQVKRFNYEWTDILGLNREEAISIIKDKLKDADLDDFVRGLDGSMSYRPNELFTPEEFFALVNEKLSDGYSKFPYAIKDFLHVARKITTPDDSFMPPPLTSETRAEIKQIFDRFYKIGPAEWMYSMHEMHEFYEAEDVEQKVWQISYDLKAVRTAVSTIQEWGNLIGQEKTLHWLKHHAPATSIEQMWSIKQCMSFIPPAEQAQYVEMLIELNPAAAAFAERTGEPFSKLIKGEPAWDRLMALDPKEQPLPQLFKENREETAKSANMPGVVEIMLVRFASYFRNLGTIEQAGMMPTFEHIVSVSVKGIKQERACLDLFVSWSLLRTGEPLHEGEETPQTLSELESIVFAELTNRLNLPENISPDQRENFSEEMGGVSAFATYFVQYENSPDHLKLLQEIFLSIANGQFKEWKYGELNNLDQLKDRKFLPEKLTPEQYISWQEDDITDSLESLSVSAEGVAQKIHQTIANNAEHLYLGEFLSTTANIAEGLAIVTQEQQKIGKEIAAFNQEFNAIKKQQPLDEQLIREKNEELRQLTIKADYFKLVKKILTLAQITPQEVAMGYFMKGDKKTDSVDSVLQEISKLLQTLSERGFHRDNLDTTLLAMISSYLQEQKDKGLQSKQRLMTTDSSSPKVFLEVGNNPVESCQNYAFGAYNECLLGYSEPNTKILIIRNEKGNIIARSIFRLLTDNQTGEPALHVEAVYSSSSSDTVNNLIYQHAVKKANRMGIKAFISERAQNEQGVLVEADLGDRVSTQKSDSTLESFNARAPYSYVDSAGGKKEKGEFSIERVLEISFSFETRISQIVEDAFQGLNSDEAVEKVTSGKPEISSVYEEDLDEVVAFYNKHFSKSPHSREFKEDMYGNESRSPVILQMRVNGKIIGLLEAWNDKVDPSRKVLATLAIDPEYRRHGYARQLFEEARKTVEADDTVDSWVVHFREGNRGVLAKMYASYGFENLIEADTTYRDGETKWEMTMSSGDPWQSKRNRIDNRSLEFS